MDPDPARVLTEFQPRHRFLIGIDSDGCAFDTMELKHKRCFIPNTIRHFALEPVADQARQAAEFVNLYSRWRGINRFPALVRVMDLLAARPDVQRSGCPIPRLSALRAWIDGRPQLGNPALAAAVARARGPAAEELARVLRWSEAVNATVRELVVGVPPFPGVRAALALAAERADIVVVSATPGEALHREWREHGLADRVAAIAGQELGSKADHLRLAARGRYAPDRVLMIGDAPGDLDAARAAGALFYPIHPGGEVAAWARLLEEGLERFFGGRYAGAYEARLVADFAARLPETPPWATAAA